jgi:isoleucyl-tRNA synthetase
MLFFFHMVDSPKQGGEELRHPQEHKPKGPLAAREEEILEFWNRERIFEKSLQKPAPKGEYVFYDGPPFASGLPHYGHLLQSAIKDAIPRYRTMQGYHVARQWGWDCHGLPVENLVEKELGFKSKIDIEQYGIEKFNETARRSIMKDVSDWKRIIPRLGRWVDMERDYKTMDATYTESVWWAFKNLYDRGLVYEGFKSMQMCPRCGTTLSNFEVAQGYKDIDDIAVTVKLVLVDEPDTALLAWTTTPWTLPGNAAAAVNANETYVKVKTDQGFVVLAKARIEAVLGEGAKVVGELQGKELVGKRYLPPFDYYATELHKHKTHAWKVYGAPFVTMTDGTGIVHIAPAFGSDDLELATKEKIPLIHHVADDGKFVALVRDFAGLPVKPKGNPRETDEKVAALLQERRLLFKQEKINHSYPHCWRCDTPLLNWAANSWFVKVSDLKQKLLAENAKVSWVPNHVGTGRFNNGIESAPDWAISRSRYWGAPLPVWRNTKTKEIKVAGSVLDVLSMVRRSGNRYFVMRHGEAKHNLHGDTDYSGDSQNHLTDKGRTDALHTAAELKKEKIDLIIASPLLRTQETAKITQKELDLPDSALMTDERLREVNFGSFDGGKIKEWQTFFGSMAERFTKAPEGGESYKDVRQRVGELLFEVEHRYANKNVLFVTSNGPAWLMMGVAKRKSIAEVSTVKDDHDYFVSAQAREMPFTPFPHNRDYELDLHRPYIDEIAMGNSVEGEWRRVPDVFDCWFESGSMPFARHHYPFAKDDFDPKRLLGWGSKGYPAHFIAEALDQTRGWFYSLIVLGAALFGKAPYKNVITTGMILASDGQKMSKRLKNYPDPLDMVEKYGADALRYYLLASPIIRGEDLKFQEKGVDEVSKKLLMRLDNVRSFYDLYAGGAVRSDASVQVLDRWILSRLRELVSQTTDGFESYQLDNATRPLGAFIDDLSNWYVRRSRDRCKADTPERQAALATLRYVLYITAHVMAPTMPFFADDLYRRVKEDSDPESVHLSHWPELGATDEQLNQDMQRVRDIASTGLQLREKASIKVRQPLGRLTIDNALPDELANILKDELNVKEIVVGESVELDTEITPELREEGLYRELVRRIQDMRKEQGLVIADRPDFTLALAGEEAVVARKHSGALIEATNLSTLTITDASDTHN